MNALTKPSRPNQALLFASLLLGSTWALADEPVVTAPEEGPVVTQELRETNNYHVKTASIDELRKAAPTLPDLSGYTSEAVDARIQRTPGGTVSVKRMLGEVALKDFIGGNNRMAEWVKRQKGMPQAIFLEGGYLTVADIAKQVPDQYLSEVEPGVYLARIPILVKPGATLHINSDVKELRLSEEGGSFLVNDGAMAITDTKVTAWREADQTPAWFRGEKQFRPFFVSWGGSDTYISGSVITSLGYSTSKSYGVSITQYTPNAQKKLQRPEPSGWILNSEFIDVYYGFYCYEARDVVLLGNTYRENIVYGIDPHDRSHGLIIANNTVYGTKKKHGIIISREVNDSWIINNKTYNNKLSGIVLDRNSVRNVVAYNEVFKNQSDGITIYESSDNLLWGNQVIKNRRHGIRLRNSVNIQMYENLSFANGLNGIYGHTKDLSDTDRNIQLDPFDTEVSMVVVGGRLAGNGSNPLMIDSPLSVELYNVDMFAPTKSTGISFSGILGEKQNEIFDLLVRQQKAVLIDPIETQAELQN